MTMFDDDPEVGDYERYVLSPPSYEQLLERADIARKAIKEAFADRDPGDETDCS